MAITEVGIVNTALIRIGADRISSLTQDTRSAVLANTIFDTARDDVLRSHPWNFAMKRATLAPTGTEPTHGWDYEYDLPNDCLRVWLVERDDVPDIDFVVEDAKILSDEADLDVTYIYRNEDPSSWDTMFADALAWRLAEDLAYALTQSATLVDMCRKRHKEVMSQARSIDGAEGIIRSLSADEWLYSRR